MSLAKIMEKHGKTQPVKKLIKDISKAACKGIESLWSEFLEIGDLALQMPRYDYWRPAAITSRQ